MEGPEFALVGVGEHLRAEHVGHRRVGEVAVVEGLGIQAAVDPHGFERDRAYALWQKVITLYLRDLTDDATAASRGAD